MSSNQIEILGKQGQSNCFCKNASSQTPVGTSSVENLAVASEEAISGQAAATWVMVGKTAWIPGHPDPEEESLGIS